NPVGPFGLARDPLDARPGKALTPDADAVAKRFVAAERQIKERVPGIDDDGAGRFVVWIRDHLATQRRRRLIGIRGRRFRIARLIDRTGTIAWKKRKSLRGGRGR